MATKSHYQNKKKEATCELRIRGTPIMKMLNPCHPGEILQDNLDAARLSPKRISAHLGFEPQTLIGVLEGSAAMSIELALAVEQYGRSNADFWMRLQANYDEAQASRRQREIP